MKKKKRKKRNKNRPVFSPLCDLSFERVRPSNILGSLTTEINYIDKNLLKATRNRRIFFHKERKKNEKRKKTRYKYKSKYCPLQIFFPSPSTFIIYINRKSFEVYLYIIKVRRSNNDLFLFFFFPSRGISTE